MSIIKSNLNIKDEFKIYACDNSLFFFDVKESGECTFLISHDNKTICDISIVKHIVQETKPEVYVFGNHKFPKINNKYINVKYYECNVNAFIILYPTRFISGSDSQQTNVNKLIFYNIDTKTDIQNRFSYIMYNPKRTSDKFPKHVSNVLGNLRDMHTTHKQVYDNLFKYLSNNLRKEFDKKTSEKMYYDNDLNYLYFSVICGTIKGIVYVANNKISFRYNQFIVFKTKYYIIAFENTHRFTVYDYNLNELHRFDDNVILNSVADTQIEYSVKYNANSLIDQVIDFTDLFKSKNIIKSEEIYDASEKIPQCISAEDAPPPYENTIKKERCVIM